MTDKPISPLRRRMIEDMTIRGLADKTQTGYIRHTVSYTHLTLPTTPYV